MLLLYNITYLNYINTLLHKQSTLVCIQKLMKAHFQSSPCVSGRSFYYKGMDDQGIIDIDEECFLLVNSK